MMLRLYLSFNKTFPINMIMGVERAHNLADIEHAFTLGITLQPQRRGLAGLTQGEGVSLHNISAGSVVAAPPGPCKECAQYLYLNVRTVQLCPDVFLRGMHSAMGGVF